MSSLPALYLVRINFQERYDNCHFAEVKTVAQELYDLFQVTQVINSRSEGLFTFLFYKNLQFQNMFSGHILTFVRPFSL
jgi:hypothetical protein